ALVGTRGATLEALQELSRLAVYRATGEPSRLLLDVGGFRASRRKELVAVAKNAAERVKLHGEAVRLEPMSAFERKCVHDVINAMAGVESESEGVGPSRRIVVRAVCAARAPLACGDRLRTTAVHDGGAPTKSIGNGRLIRTEGRVGGSVWRVRSRLPPPGRGATRGRSGGGRAAVRGAVA